jgi:hypothetical protein
MYFERTQVLVGTGSDLSRVIINEILGPMPFTTTQSAVKYFMAVLYQVQAVPVPQKVPVFIKI